jgi:hypothetical protein
MAIGVIYEALIQRSVAGALSLTGAGLVAIINFRLLEALVERVVQAGQPKFDLGSVLQLIGRFALVGCIMLGLAYLPRIDGVAVALGFTSVVIALLAESVRWARAGGG